MRPDEVLNVGQELNLEIAGTGKLGDLFGYHQRIIVILKCDKDERPNLGEKVKVRITSVKERTAFAELVR